MIWVLRRYDKGVDYEKEFEKDIEFISDIMSLHEYAYLIRMLIDIKRVCRCKCGYIDELIATYKKRIVELSKKYNVPQEEIDEYFKLIDCYKHMDCVEDINDKTNMEVNK